MCLYSKGIYFCWGPHKRCQKNTVAAMDLTIVVQRLMARGWSQTEIAIACGSTQGSISQIRHGKCKPSYTLGSALVNLYRDTVEGTTRPPE